MDQKSSNIFNKKPKPSRHFHSSHVYWQNVYQCFQCSRKKLKQMHHYKNFSQTGAVLRRIISLHTFLFLQEGVLFSRFWNIFTSSLIPSVCVHNLFFDSRKRKRFKTQKQKRIQNVRFNCSRNKYKHQHKGAANKNKTGS